jgi:hypothetical protein
MRKLLASMNLEKCELATKTLLPFIEKEIQNWHSIK